MFGSGLKCSKIPLFQCPTYRNSDNPALESGPKTIRFAFYWKNFLSVIHKDVRDTFRKASMGAYTIQLCYISILHQTLQP